MSDDIVERLREAAQKNEEWFAGSGDYLFEAADEIDRLRARLAEVERGHQDFHLQNDREWKAVSAILAAAPIRAEVMEEAAKDVLAHLVAAHSLLSRSPKTAAPSDKMFDQMLADYQAAIDRCRRTLAGEKP